MRHRIAALTGAGVMIAALGAAPAAASAVAAGPAVGRSALTAATTSTTCGSWRWPVKTGSDATRYQVSRTISNTSVGYLDHLTPPASFGSYAQNHRIKWAELRTWQIDRVTLVAVKLEDDNDLHLRLRSATGHDRRDPPAELRQLSVPVEDRHHLRPERRHEPVLDKPLSLALYLQEHQHPRARLLR
jgi:hypothetical protein